MRIKNKTRQLRLDETESDFALRQRMLNYGGNDMNDGSSSSGFSSEQDRTRDTNQYIDLINILQHNLDIGNIDIGFCPATITISLSLLLEQYQY